MNHAKQGRMGRQPRLRRGWLECVLIVPVLALMVGCQNRSAAWNPTQWGRMERIPPPATGSLQIPGMSPGYPGLGQPTGPLTAPPSQLPPMGNPAGAGQGQGQMGTGVAPGVYFPNGTNGSTPAGSANPAAAGTGTSPWQGAGTPTYNAIPDRAASTAAAGTPTASPTGATGGFDLSAAPPLLPGGFDPYSTAQTPAFSGQHYNVGHGSSNPLLVTNQPTSPPGGQDGWFPGQLQGAQGMGLSSSSPQASGLGSGGLLRRWFGSPGGRFQPANVTGYMTTAPIENPMIPVTPPAGTGSGGWRLGSRFQPQPVMPGSGGSPGTGPGGVSYSRWLDAQAAAQAQAQQQAAWQQAAWQQAAWQQAAAGGMPVASTPVAWTAGAGTGAYQVLAENTTAATAENQARQGLVSPRPTPGGYPAGVIPPGSAAPSAFRGATRPISSTDQSQVNSSWQPAGVR